MTLTLTFDLLLATEKSVHYSVSRFFCYFAVVRNGPVQYGMFAHFCTYNTLSAKYEYITNAVQHAAITKTENMTRMKVQDRGFAAEVLGGGTLLPGRYI